MGHGWHSRFTSSVHAIVSYHAAAHRVVQAVHVRFVTLVHPRVWYVSAPHRARHVRFRTPVGQNCSVGHEAHTRSVAGAQGVVSYSPTGQGGVQLARDWLPRQ